MTQYRVNSHALRVFSLALAFALLFITVLPALNPARAAFTEDSFSEIMAVILDSWGISFRSSSDSDILEDLNTMTEEFIEDSGYLADEFFRPMQVGVDKLGQLLLDHTTLGRFIQFAQWLVNKYHLSDDSTVNIRGSSGMLYYAGMPCFMLPYTQIVQREGRTDYLYIDITSSSSPVFVIFMYSSNGSHIYPIYFTQQITTVTVTSKQNVGYNPSNPIIATTNTYTLNSYSSPWYYTTSTASFNASSWSPAFPYVVSYIAPADWASIFSANPNLPTSFGTPFYIDTRTIDIPEPEGDDGLVVSVPGVDWGATLTEVLDLIERLLILYDDSQLGVLSILRTVEDIIDALQNPVDIQESYAAIVPPVEEFNIPVESSWLGFASPFVQNVNGLQFWHDMVYSFPAPVVNIFISFVCFILIYAFVRMGRDSH